MVQRSQGDRPSIEEVARATRRISAGIPVAYVSGHAAWPGNRRPDSIMLEKPFALALLLTAIAQLLNDRPPREI